jgi:hypothetical protein
MDIRTTSLDFSLPLSGSGPRTASQTVVFPRPVTMATAGLTGYLAEYSGGNDHHVGQFEIKLDTVINDNTVTVNGTFGLRDWSGNWDDQYDGTVQCVVVADLEDPSQEPPRTDLIITGAELNQAVQFFRAGSYLDAAHVMPDNSIWLVARKNTGVRIYVDYERDPAQPAIANLTGSLIVNTGSSTVTLSPINAGGSIQPRPDSQINIANANHTLNFMIPAALSAGEITITCRVWDQADPAQRPSPALIRTLTFTPVQPLSLFLVGVNYNAVTPNLAAPTQAAISASLSQLTKTYPVGDIIQTGYTTLNFAETVTGNVANGCGSGFNDLLDRLNDLRGSSPDIYLGSLPAGIVSTPGNSIGGCAPQPGRVAGVFVDLPGDVPHEIGHDLGRGHAPCTGGRCNPPPANVDSNYPQYGNFPSDSIGVFGFDPTANTVFNPASTFDFMAYSFPQWVSAYTYNGLRGSSFGSTGGPGPGGAGAHLVGGVDIMTLFLGLTINRDRSVKRRPSFHFLAPLFGRSGCGEHFTVEFLGVNRQVLSCTPLFPDCSAGCCCWPKVIRNDVPFPSESRWMLIWEGDRKLYEEEIPAPPIIHITSTQREKDGVILSWDVEKSSSGATDQCCLWYLVQWLDPVTDDWRGLTARQKETSILIPRRYFDRSSELQVRVLATSGIATGTVETTIVLDETKPPYPKAQLTLVGVSTETRPTPLPNVIQSLVTDSLGRQIPTDRITWYGNEGVELGRGRQLDLRGLTLGRHTLRLVAQGLGGATVARTWLLERTRTGILLLGETAEPEIPAQEPHQHPHPAPSAENN